MERVEALCLQYRNVLEITDNENERYMQKSKNLAVLYAWLLWPWPYWPDAIEWSAKAGFLSAAYDVSTDWNRDINLYKQIFMKIVQEQTSPELWKMALNMFEKDIWGTLDDYWLERGSVSLNLIGKTLGITEEDFIRIHGVDISTMWSYLQIVDDVLDVEEDLDLGQINFLQFPSIREEYLDDFIIFFTEKHFPGTFLQFVIDMSVKKALRIKNFIS